jgi:hypothetical protein
MAKWTVEALAADRSIVTLTRPETMVLRPGSFVDFKRDKRWAGGNTGRIVALGEKTATVDVASVNRRTKYSTNATELGRFEVPYSAIEGTF